MHRRLLGWCLFVGLPLLVGCNGGDDGASGTTTSSTGVDQTSTTEPETTTTLSREDSLRRRVVELLELRSALLQDPDPDRLGEWLLPACPCYEVEQRILDDYLTNGYRLNGPDAEILGVELIDDDRSVPAFAVARRLPEVHVIDGAGALVHNRPARDTYAVAVTLDQTEDGRWLVVDLFELSPTPERLNEIIAAGLP